MFVKYTEIQVRGYHCDAYGHVNNARYLEFLEEGRWNWLQQSMDLEVFQKKGLLFVVVNLNISYKKPLIPGNVARVTVKDLRFNNMSMVLSQQILNEAGDVCALADVTFVLLSANTQKPVPIDDDLKSFFKLPLN